MSSCAISRPGRRPAATTATNTAPLLATSRRVQAPVELPDRRHVCHVYAVRADDRDDLAAALKADGIVDSGLHYPIPVHLQKAHADLGYGVGDFPQSERAAKEVLSLPLYPADDTEARSKKVVTAVGADEPMSA